MEWLSILGVVSAVFIYLISSKSWGCLTTIVLMIVVVAILAYFNEVNPPPKRSGIQAAFSNSDRDDARQALQGSGMPSTDSDVNNALLLKNTMEREDANGSR